MSDSFGNAFSRSFSLLFRNWFLVLYHFIGAIAGVLVFIPVFSALLFFYFRPIVENFENVDEMQIIWLVVEFLLSPGLFGAALMISVVMAVIALQAFWGGALGGAVADAIRGVPVSLAKYFRNGFKYWVRVFAVTMLGTALTGVPGILFFKFVILNNLEGIIENPDALMPSVAMSAIDFVIYMVVLLLVYSVTTYFWLPALILGERDLLRGLKESAVMGLRNFLYLVVLAVIQMMVYSAVNGLSGIDPLSRIIGLLVTIITYILIIYFTFFKYVWYAGNKYSREDREGGVSPEEVPGEASNVPPGTVI